MSSNGPPGSRPEAEQQKQGGAEERRTADEGLGAPPEPPRVPATRVPVAKLGKKDKKFLKDAQRPLDSWERYRALTDTLDEAIDLVDLADHKARFALVILAAVNVLLFLTADKLDALKGIPQQFQVVLAGYLLLYVIMALYFFIQAIEALRPRKEQPQVPSVTETSVEDYPLGIRFYEDVLRRDVEAFQKAWREVRLGQLNGELMVQIHAMAAINRAKYGSLRRLYKGLQIMTIMAVGLVGLAAAAGFIGTAKKASQPTLRGSELIGTATRVGHPGVKEPSGIVFHPGMARMFLVGDEGTLAELDLQGQTLRTTKIEDQIEDVTVHGPTASLVFISEKKSELIFYDPVKRQERSRFQIDTAAVLGIAPTEKNQGFEGLTFRPEAGRPGGGVFYLTHQRAPAMIVALTVDPAVGGGRVGAESVVARMTVEGYEDLTAITYVPSLDRLLVVIDSRERVLVLRMDGTQEKRFPIPGEQQEGLAFDDEGTMWVADDKDKSVLRIPAALDRLEGYLRGEAAPAASPAKETGFPF